MITSVFERYQIPVHRGKHLDQTGRAGWVMLETLAKVLGKTYLDATDFCQVFPGKGNVVFQNGTYVPADRAKNALLAHHEGVVGWTQISLLKEDPESDLYLYCWDKWVCWESDADVTRTWKALLGFNAKGVIVPRKRSKFRTDGDEFISRPIDGQNWSKLKIGPLVLIVHWIRINEKDRYTTTVKKDETSCPFGGLIGLSQGDDGYHIGSPGPGVNFVLEHIAQEFNWERI
jgi:hypothetical protein